MSERVIVIGASGHGKVAADIVRCSGDTLLGFLDDNALLPPMVAGIPVLGRVADYVNYPDTSFVIGIGTFCGKKPQTGNYVSHSNIKTKRVFNPNLQNVRHQFANGEVRTISVCTRCLRSGLVTKPVARKAD